MQKGELMNKIKEKLIGKHQAIIFTIIFILFIVIVLPEMAKISEDRIGVSTSPDTSFSLNLNDYYEMVEAYGNEGRSFYIQVRWTFDVIWPAVYGLFLFSTIGLFSLKSTSKQRLKYLLLPIFAVSFDIFENIFASLTMFLFPEKFYSLVVLLKISSGLKWLSLFGAFVLLFILVLKNLFHSYLNSKKI